MPKRVNTHLVMALVAAMATATPIYAQLDDPTAPQAIFEMVEAGELDVKDALSKMEDLPDGQNDPLALSVHGTLMTMRAAEQWLPYNKLKSVNEGLELLDQATLGVDTTSDDFLSVYMYAAVANAAVPGFLDRADFARQYFDAIKSHPTFEASDAEVKARVYAWLARLEGPETATGSDWVELAMALDVATAEDILDME